jgi:NADH-quinone oxidoreductase subunit L
MALVAAVFTSFYIFRLVFLTFFGQPRYTEKEVAHVHESPLSMVWPLIALAVLSVVGGFINVPAFLGGETPVVEGTATETALGVVATAAGLLGLGIAWLFYVAKPRLPERLALRAHAIYGLLSHKYYIDEIYDAVIVWPIFRTAREFLWKVIDVLVIDGIVNGVGKSVSLTARGLRHMQTGYVRTYAGWILFGGVLVIAWFLK